jgi:hypothetical protein
MWPKEVFQLSADERAKKAIMYTPIISGIRAHSIHEQFQFTQLASVYEVCNLYSKTTGAGRHKQISKITFYINDLHLSFTRSQG